MAYEQLDALERQRPSIAHVQRAAMQLASQHLGWTLQYVSLQAVRAGTCMSVLWVGTAPVWNAITEGSAAACQASRVPALTPCLQMVAAHYRWLLKVMVGNIVSTQCHQGTQESLLSSWPHLQAWCSCNHIEGEAAICGPAPLLR